jgi:hypothetical protein
VSVFRFSFFSATATFCQPSLLFRLLFHVRQKYDGISRQDTRYLYTARCCTCDSMQHALLIQLRDLYARVRYLSKLFIPFHANRIESNRSSPIPLFFLINIPSIVLSVNSGHLAVTTRTPGCFLLHPIITDRSWNVRSHVTIIQDIVVFITVSATGT